MSGFASKSIFKNLDSADYFTLISYVTLILLAAFGFTPDKEAEQTFKVFFLLASLNSLHVYFQYWMLARSPQYSLLTAKITGEKKYIKKMLLQISFVLISLFLYQTTFGSISIIMYLFGFWNIWHVSMQTKGLYYISRLSDVKEQPLSGPMKDLSFLNTYLIILMACKAVILLFHSHKNLVPPDFLVYGRNTKFFALLILLPLLIYLSYLVKSAKALSGKSFLIFLRFGFPVITIFYPLAGYAVAGLHGIEYFNLTRKIESRSRVTRNSGFLAAFFAVIIVQVAFDIFSRFYPLEENSWINYFLASWMIATSGVHFAYDGFAFRLKDKAAREEMLELIG